MTIGINKPLLSHGNIQIKLTRYGYITFFTNDMFIGRSFDLYGEYCQDLIKVITQLVKINSTVIDVGANIGAITLPLAKMVGRQGRVIAFEPMPQLFNMLCANIALNDLQQIVPMRYAVGNEREIVKLWVQQPGNIGSVTIGQGKDEAQTILLDDLQLKTCHFMKIDVEGYEQQVIEGATNTIKKFRPLLMVENDRIDKSANLIKLLQNLDYRLFWCCTRLYSPDNFYENQQDVFGQIYSVDMLAVPQETTNIPYIKLPVITSPLDRPF